MASVHRTHTARWSEGCGLTRIDTLVKLTASLEATGDDLLEESPGSQERFDAASSVRASGSL
jgi:hypothetical protein